ncbi:MAG: HDOD domain-containing protein [Chromatiales bacterium]
MSPKKLVEDIDRLVSLPDVCVKVNRVVDSSDYSAARIGEIISQDTDLSARLLRLVNSSFFGLRAPVDTISRAVTLIGTKELRNLVLATSAIRLFTGIPGDLVDMGKYWRHAIMAGVIAQGLAARCHVLHSERLFVMGVLHDIGSLVIYLTLPDLARDILLITGGDDWLLPDTEQDVLGFTHMEVGEQLLRRWGLPEGLVTIVGAHHRPDLAGEYQFDASLLHIAISLSNGEMNGLAINELMTTIHPSVWELTGLDQSEMEQIIEEIPNKAVEVMNLVISPSDRIHSSSIHCPD